MSWWIRPLLSALLMLGLVACSLAGPDPVGVVLREEVAAKAVTSDSNELEPALAALPSATPFMTATAVPTATSSPTSTASPTATTIPTVTATPVIKPADIQVSKLPFFGSPEQEAIIYQHPLFGQIFILDEVLQETPFKISWTDDNPQTAVIRFQNEDGVKVELKAGADPGRGEIPIEQEQSESELGIPRHAVYLTSGDVFPAYAEIERMATVELADEDGNVQILNILFSRHDYVEGYIGPMELAQPQYDHLEMGIDWRSEQYAMQGAFAEWLNSHSELWNLVTIVIAGREPITWRAIRENSALLHQELATANYDDEIAFYFMTADGESQRFALDRVPFYTKFEIVHSPRDEQEFYTLRAGRDPGVSEELLQEMGQVVRHMFSNRPDYLHKLALNGAVHSVAPGKDMLVLPEISILPDEIIAVIVGDEEFGAATGIALLERHPEISASAAHYFENDTPVLGYTLMHELVHQVQYMIYGPPWDGAVVQYYENYMEMPAGQRIPDIDYYETSPWEWDALLTPAWFSQGSELHEHVKPYLDLEVGDAGTTIRDYLQRRWGDPLEAYPGH